jgi:hypothetical protein
MRQYGNIKCNLKLEISDFQIYKPRLSMDLGFEIYMGIETYSRPQIGFQDHSLIFQFLG